MIALVPLRDGMLPAGADETIAECGGRVIVIGTSTRDVALDGLANEVYLMEVETFSVGQWATAATAVIDTLDDAEIVVLPNSPDGRDLAPRIAFLLDRPLLAGATEISPDRVRVVRRGGLELHEQRPTGPFVATLEPGVRGVLTLDSPPRIEHIAASNNAAEATDVVKTADAVVVEVLPPDVRTMDLTESQRIVGGGAGLDSHERLQQLGEFAASIGGVMGATRVITDRGWVHHDRQIGTTGVVIDPVLYLSFGVSGAVQHTSGLGHPDHILSVNTDPHCPMMTMSDLAIVSDANETLDQLAILFSAASHDTKEAGNA